MCMHQVMAELGVIRDIDPASIQNHFLCTHPLIGAEFPRIQGLQGLHHWVIVLVTLSDPLHEGSLFSFQCASFRCPSLDHLCGQQQPLCIVFRSPQLLCSPHQGIIPTH